MHSVIRVTKADMNAVAAYPAFMSAGAGNNIFVLMSIEAMCVQDVSEVPAPKNSSVTVRQEPGGLFGAVLFSGNAKQPRVNDKEQQLRQDLERDGTKPSSDEWLLAQYNVPWALPGFKRNEILIPVDESTFELW